MSLLKKLASLSPLQSPHAEAEKRQLGDGFAELGNSDNLRLVDVHWNNAKAIMALDEKTVGHQERCNILVYHLNEIVSVLVDEKDGDPGPCLQYVLDEDVFQNVYTWSATNKNCVKDMKREQLVLFRSLIEKARAHLLIYEQVWKPLLYLLDSCINKISPDMEEHFVAVLKGLCVSVNRDIALLDLFFLDNHHHGRIAKMSVFSLLIPFVHREGNVGNWARDAMLLCMALSSVDARLGTYIAEETDFCPVLATGLSGLFSDLPTSLDIPSEDWYSLERGLWATFPELVSFLRSLEFCNNVIQIAHTQVQSKLLDLIYHGFLVSVMAASLSQTTDEALIAATAYLDLFLRSITDANLMKVFLKFIMVERSDGVPILELLVSRIAQESQLAVVSLGLFYTLLDLNCEDIMYSLVLKYLIPCTHILSSQKRTIKEVDFYSKSAFKFLSLIPACCDSSPSSSPSWSTENQDTNPRKSPMTIDVKTSELVFYRSTQLDYLYSEVCIDYMEYLADARNSIRDCQVRCVCWCAPYDGQMPSPQEPLLVARHRSASNTPAPVANGIIPNQDQSASLGDTHIPLKRSKSVTEHEQKPSQPDLGLFLTTLFQKLEQMPQNSFYVNLILTGVVSRLALYPQPLLRSFLLNYNMVLKPGVRSLFQILSSVKIKVENIAEQTEGLDRLLHRARKNLILREEKSRASIQSVVIDIQQPVKVAKHPESRSPVAIRKISRQRTDSSLLSRARFLQDGPPPKSFGSKGSLSFRKQSVDPPGNSPERKESVERRGSASTSSSLSLSESWESLTSLYPDSGSATDINADNFPKPGTVRKLSIPVKFGQNSRKNSFVKNSFRRKNPKTVKNAVYCIVVLEEWLKELAAISQEHALLLGNGDEHPVTT